MTRKWSAVTTETNWESAYPRWTTLYLPLCRICTLHFVEIAFADLVQNLNCDKCMQYMISFIAIYQRQMLLRMTVPWLLQTMPAEGSEWSKALGHFRYMWSRSRSNPHIAFTLQNLTHLLGSKLPPWGSFDPHRGCGVDVGSKPLVLCSHQWGKWFRPRVDSMSLHQNHFPV